MIRTGQCPKCSSNKIAGPHRIHGQYPVRIDFPGILSATLEAFTCADCGFTELYSDRSGLDNIRKVGRFFSRTQGSRRVHCPYCGTEVRKESNLCSECGNTI